MDAQDKPSKHIGLLIDWLCFYEREDDSSIFLEADFVRNSITNQKCFYEQYTPH